MSFQPFKQIFWNEKCSRTFWNVCWGVSVHRSNSMKKIPFHFSCNTYIRAIPFKFFKMKNSRISMTFYLIFRNHKLKMFIRNQKFSNIVFYGRKLFQLVKKSVVLLTALVFLNPNNKYLPAVMTSSPRS